MSYQTDLEFARGKANAWKHLQEKAANGLCRRAGAVCVPQAHGG